MANFLSRRKQAFGIEISDASIKVIQLKKSGQFYKLVGYNITKIPDKLVVSGEIKNKKSVAEHIQKALMETKPGRISTSFAVCSLPENKTFVRILEVPKMPPEEMQNGIKWQAEQYIPLPIESIYLDWQIINEENNKLKVLVAATPKKCADQYVATLKLAKLKPLVLDLEEAAEARTVVPQNNKQASLIIDIGATKTVFVVQDKNVTPFASSTQSVSGQEFTRAIAKGLKIKEQEAEEKKVACCSPELTEEEKRILQTLYPLFDKLASEILKITKYYQDHFKDSNPIANIFLCGGSAAVSSLVPHLSLKIKKKITLGDPLVNVPSKKQLQINKIDLLSLTTTIGLAVRGINVQEYQRR